jgi:SAM-dependent methyltransferase
MSDWSEYQDRYLRGEWRDRLFHEMILKDADERGTGLTFLDIGCGRGFDTDVPLQESLIRHAGRYIGIEPDKAIEPNASMTEYHQCFLEDAPIPPGSVDMAFAVMVLEHVPEPKPFWDKLHEVLREGGVFWGFTVDARHPIALATRLMGRLKLKEAYLDRLHGKRGVERYEDYPVHYRTNTPEAVRGFGSSFRKVDLVPFARPGVWGGLLPRPLRPLAERYDRWAMAHDKATTLLAIRAEK